MKAPDAQALLIRQYADLPNARGTVALVVGQIDVAADAIDDLPETLDMATAEGVNLDLVGKHVGADRRLTVASSAGLVLSDDDYRVLVKARAAKNFMVGTGPDMAAGLEFLFGPQATFIDHQNMSVTVLIAEESLDDFRRYAVAELDILPRPAGMRLHRLAVPNPYFGFLEDTDPRRGGFDDSAFVVYF